MKWAHGETYATPVQEALDHTWEVGSLRSGLCVFVTVTPMGHKIRVCARGQDLLAVTASTIEHIEAPHLRAEATP